VAAVIKEMRTPLVKGGQWEPKNWREMWNLILEMRRENPAAVDTMGARTLSDPKASDNEQAFHTLVGLMLSSQTKDEVTSATMKYLV
jgi:endonuclease-3